jgi:hypothetical protein
MPRCPFPAAEKARLLAWIDWTRQHLTANLVLAPDGFNLGVKDGQAPGKRSPSFIST